MVNNRLYIVDDVSLTYVCIGKQFDRWQLGNIDLAEKFLNEFYGNELRIVNENDDDFIFILKHCENYNKTNKWISNEK